MGQTLAQGAGQVVAVRAGHLVDPATASVTDNQLILVKDGKILSDVVVDLPGESRADMVFDYLAVWQQAGVPAPDILQAFTVNGFALLRLDKQRGPIAVGLAADMIAVPANPLQDIQILKKVNFVMKDGKIVRKPD